MNIRKIIGYSLRYWFWKRISDPMNPDGPFPDAVFMDRFDYRLLGSGEGSPVLYTRRNQ